MDNANKIIHKHELHCSDDQGNELKLKDKKASLFLIIYVCKKTETMIFGNKQQSALFCVYLFRIRIE